MATFVDCGTAHTASAMMKMVVDVSLTPPFTQFYSCGFDDSVKIWRKNEGEYVSSEFPTIGKCLGLIAVNKNIFIGEESQDLLSGATRHAVVSYDINTKRCSEAYLDFSMPVSAMDVSADGNLFVAGAEDYVLKFRRDLNHEQIRDRRDLNGLPVNISCSPSSKYVVVSTSDGQVTVYEVIELIQEKISFKTNRGFNVVENDTSRMQCAWHPTGMNLYIPSDDGIIVVACRDWTKEKTLLPEGASMEEFSICAISLEGRYLAAYSLSGNVYIYRTATYDLVSTITLETPSVKVLSMVFDPIVDEDEQTYDLLLMDES
uniref:Uncharacterized protein n=1 Tax=Panagrolaimus sp. JU765 TaxID=591449 RepID=A0AC34RN48_9BILA